MNNIIQRIADYADIDTRRAMGIYRRLPPSNFNPRPIPPTSWRYWPETQTAIFINFTPDYGPYEFEVHKGLLYTPENEYEWEYNDNASIRMVYVQNEQYKYQITKPLYKFGFFAGLPDFI